MIEQRRRTTSSSGNNARFARTSEGARTPLTHIRIAQKCDNDQRDK